jgi:uncharacterized protein (TIGR00299 family) protein
MTATEQAAGVRHLHLEPLGGLAGDMFVAAMLNAWPDLTEGAIGAVRAAGLPQSVAVGAEPHDDGVLTGMRFVVSAPDDHEEGHLHEHTRFDALQARLKESDLTGGTLDRTLDIFTHLARAEGAVHGLPVGDVTFHEVGNWDSIADIVAAAHVIEQVGAAKWSAGSLPLGAGQVKTAHGLLPVPAPAVAELLKGFEFHDDGVGGERVTPTGAAILRHLKPEARPAGGTLGRSGNGFGTRRLKGMSNILRVMEFEGAAVQSDVVGELRFEIDDQTAEDLAVGLDQLRRAPGVLDVLQWPAFGKKGRMVAQIQVLAEVSALDAVSAACFRETTTLGLRRQLVSRTILPREASKHGVGEDVVRVKAAERPGGGRTAKTEIDDVAEREGGHDARERRRAQAEQSVLKNGESDD